MHLILRCLGRAARWHQALTPPPNDGYAMAYVHDVFVSYMHDAQMESWVHSHFLPFLRTFVGNALNRPVDFFVDREGITTGDSWPLKLQQAIVQSRCLIPVWSPLYFHSSWCRKECAAMLYREAQSGFRTVSNPSGLVAPVNVFDGQFFPDKAKQIEWLDCQRFWVVGDGFSRTERYVEFQDILRSWAVDVAAVIEGAPPWQDAWMTDAWLQVDDSDLMPRSSTNFAFAGLD